jgi:hypothetical protein
VVDGKLVFPQCTKEVREGVMKMQDEAQKKGQKFEDYIKSLDRPIPIPKFEIKCK